MHMDMVENLVSVLNICMEPVLAEKDGCILFRNTKAEQLFGKALIGLPLTMVFPAEICALEPKDGVTLRGTMHVGEEDGEVTVGRIHDIRIFTVNVQNRKKDSRFVNVLLDALRSPTSNILVAAEIMHESDVFVGDEAQSISGMFMRDAMRMLRIAENIDLLAKLLNGQIKLKKQPVDMVQLCEKTIGFVSEITVDRGVAIKYAGSVAEHVVYTDVRLMEILFLNLLSNAIKFAGRGGKVTVSFAKTNKSFNISVRDNGIGISNEVMDTLFERYRTAGREKGPGEGTGVGLAIVSAIAELLDGRILVESREGGGAVFAAVFPSESGELPEEAGSENAVWAPDKKLIMTQLSDALGYKAFSHEYL